MWLYQPLLPGGGQLLSVVAPTITTTSLNALQVGVAFSQQLAATGDTATWSGTVPDGLTLSSSGLLSGTPTTAGAYSFTVTATNAGGSDDQVYTGTIGNELTGCSVTADSGRYTADSTEWTADGNAVCLPALSTGTGGDDRIDRGHRGSGKRSTLKRKRDQEFDAQVRDIYRDLMGDPRTADEAQAIVAAVTEPVRVKGESEAAHEAALMARAEAMRKRADAMDADAMQAEIALRFLHKRLRDMQEDEDVEAVEFLLSQVL